MPRRKATRRATDPATDPRADLARRAAPDRAAPDRAAPGRAAGAPPAVRVLVIDSGQASREAIVRALRGAPIDVEVAPNIAKARAALANSESPGFDCIVLDMALPAGGASQLLRELADTSGRARRPSAPGTAGDPGTASAPGDAAHSPTTTHSREQPPGARVICTASSPTLEQAVEAMRMGAADLIARPFDPTDLATRVLDASRRARADRDRFAEVDRLRRACKRLSDARRQVARQVDSLCNDLADAYQELADHMSNAAITSEFAALVRNELDVESLLRTCLEFILGRTGPTNAAVFLPSNHADFALGAYVNYDCPKDSADVLLDHLADVLAPKIQDETGVIRMDTEDALARRMGDDAHWLEGSDALAFSCRHDGDCLAVGVLFRDRKNPFSDDAVAQLKSVADIFGKQLARVVKIHHRHRPEEAWPGFERDSDDEGGLAA